MKKKIEIVVTKLDGGTFTISQLVEEKEIEGFLADINKNGVVADPENSREVFWIPTHRIYHARLKKG